MRFSIRGKIVFPYLLLTLVVAIAGAYIVTYLVASLLDERLTNQLLEAERVVSGELVRREINHLEAVRIVVAELSPMLFSAVVQPTPMYTRKFATGTHLITSILYAGDNSVFVSGHF
jgi:hypothetical protein